MTSRIYRFETFTCPSCTMKIEAALKDLKGVEEYEVFFNSSKVRVEFDDSIISEDIIIKSIESLGFIRRR